MPHHEQLEGKIIQQFEYTLRADGAFARRDRHDDKSDVVSLSSDEFATERGALIRAGWMVSSWPMVGDVFHITVVFPFNAETGEISHREVFAHKVRRGSGPAVDCDVPGGARSWVGQVFDNNTRIRMTVKNKTVGKGVFRGFMYLTMPPQSIE